MSIEAIKFMEAVLERFGRRVLSPADEDVLEAVAYRTLPNSFCSCGEQKLAERSRASVRSVRRALVKATDLGIIQRIPQMRGKGEGRGRACDAILIVGFNDELKFDADTFSGNTGRITGQDGSFNRTAPRFQPDRLSAPYSESKNIIDKSSLPPSPKDRIAIKEGRIYLSDEFRSTWLSEFDGDAKSLDLALIIASNYVRPNSGASLETQVAAQLARTASQRREQDKRYQAAVAAKSKQSPSVPRSRTPYRSRHEVEDELERIATRFLE